VSKGGCQRTASVASGEGALDPIPQTRPAIPFARFCTITRQSKHLDVSDSQTFWLNDGMAGASGTNRRDESQRGHAPNEWQTMRATAARGIVFDEDDSANPQKRRRVSKACDQCRQGKLKCNGAIPRCSTCMEVKKPCTYGTTTRRRGLRTGYVRALECLWGLVFQSIAGSEDVVEILIANTSRKSFWVRDELRDAHRTEDMPLETWKLSRIPQAIDEVLSLNEEMDDDSQATVLSNTSPSTKVINPSWSLQDQPLPNEQTQPSTASQTICWRCCADVQEQPWKQIAGAPGQSRVEGTARTISKLGQSLLPELPLNSQKLLDQYFALTHSWFPVVERHGVYKSLFAYRKRLATKDVKDRKTGEEALLWAIFAYSIAMHHLSDVEEGSIQQSMHPPNPLYMIARNNIPVEVEDSYSDGHVQALLILALLHYSSGQWGLARIMIGQAILVASHLGLDQCDKGQPDRHRRIWLGCFALDTLTSVHTEKPSWIRSLHVHPFLPLLDETGNEEWEPWHLRGVLLTGLGAEMAEFAAPTHTISIFNKLLELLCITNDWMHAATDDQKDECKRGLKSWEGGLPEHINAMFSVEAFSAATIPPPANILNLRMTHVLLSTKLSNSMPTGMPLGFNWDQEWKMLIGAMEGFLGRFDQRALPPSFNLLKSVLPHNASEHVTAYKLMTDLKKRVYDQENMDHLPLDLADPDIFDHENTESAPVPQQYVAAATLANGHQPNVSEPSRWLEAYNAGKLKVDAITYNLDPQIEHNFGSFINIDGSWTDELPDLLSEPQPGNCEDLGSLIEQQQIGPVSVGDVSSQGLFSEDAGPDMLNIWDDIEVYVLYVPTPKVMATDLHARQDRDQFRRNLGFQVLSRRQTKLPTCLMYHSRVCGRAL
jgi:hypothetical protein